MSRHSSRIGLVGAAVAVLAVLGTGAALAAEQHDADAGGGPSAPSPLDRSDATTFRLYGEADTEADVDIPVDGDATRMEPMPGDRTLFRDVLYELDDSDPIHPTKAGEPIGEALIDCTVRSVDTEAGDAQQVCDAVVDLYDRGRLYLATAFRFSEFEDPGHITGGVLGGDGTYAGAGGDFTFRQFLVDEEGEATIATYEIRL